MNTLLSKLKIEYFLLFSWLFTIADGWTNSEKCGIVSSRRQLVYFGEDAQPYNVPWMVSLQTSSGHHFCGGSIISSTLILTAAHCIESKLWFQIFAVIGEYWRHTASESQFTEVKMISQIIPHEGYVYTGSLVYDIALLELSTPIDFPEGGEIAPVCLPEYTIPPYYDTVMVHGWGQTESGSGTTFLQSGSLTLQTPFYCSLFHGGLSDTMVCASEFLEQNEGPDDNAIDSCYGDSGSGLVHQREDGAHEIVGIVSWGVHCGNVMTPGVYSSVSRFIGWIDSKARCENSTLVDECTECYEWTTCDIVGCNSSMRGDPCAARPVCDHCSEVIQCFPSPDFSNANCTQSDIPTSAPTNPTVSPTHIPSPAGETPLPFIQGYVPPIGCFCVETSHPTLGLVSAYCSKRFESESTPWCYVEGDCVSIPSQAIPGATYAYCSNILMSTASPIPRCDVVLSPDAIHVCGGSLTQCARTEIICPDNYDACCHQLNSLSCTFPTSAHYCVPRNDSAVIEIDECEQCFLDQNRDATIEVYSLGECTDTISGWYTARSISQCSNVKESLGEMHDCLAFSDCESCTSNGCKFSELANACFSRCVVCPWDMVEESEHCENNLNNPSTEDFICTPDACSWSDYVEGEDWGYYSESNGDCAHCQAQCALDDNCGGLECGGSGNQAYCSWWKVGVCQTGTHWADSIITCRRTDIDTQAPTIKPTDTPTLSPTVPPTSTPTQSPTLTPTSSPTLAPTSAPTQSATTPVSTLSPTLSPTLTPTFTTTNSPTSSPTTPPTSPYSVEFIFTSIAACSSTDTLAGDRYFLQVSEITFYDANQEQLSYTSFVVEDGDSPSGEDPMRALDNNLDTKWLDRGFSCTRNHVHGVASGFSGVPAFYTFSTANDAPPRDPNGWNVRLCENERCGDPIIVQNQIPPVGRRTQYASLYDFSQNLTPEPSFYPSVSSPSFHPSASPFTSSPTEQPLTSPPSQAPTPGPSTSEPSPSPTDEPSNLPSPSPTSEPSAHPTSTSEPSENPTSTDEPVASPSSYSPSKSPFPDDPGDCDLEDTSDTTECLRAKVRYLERELEDVRESCASDHRVCEEAKREIAELLVQ